MPELKIDYTGIPQTEVIAKSSYRPPRHVFFGKRDPETGMMEEEPKYVHQEYPKMLYKLMGEVIKAEIVMNDKDRDAKLEDGWATNPAKFGYLTAPSFDEVQAMKAKDEAAERAASEPLDHVEDDELIKARAEWEAKFNKRPHHKKSLETLKAELAA